MGAYLSAPKTEKTSEDGGSNTVKYGVSSMQGWRVSMEDAHICMPELDKDTSMFAVFDGHGGSEVADYCALHFHDVIKNTEAYKKGNLKQGLVDAFLSIDDQLTKEEAIAELKELAGENKDDEGDVNEADMLAEEANMPIEELLKRIQEGKAGQGGYLDDAIGDEDEESDYNEDEEDGEEEEEEDESESEEKENKQVKQKDDTKPAKTAEQDEREKTINGKDMKENGTGKSEKSAKGTKGTKDANHVEEDSEEEEEEEDDEEDEEEEDDDDEDEDGEEEDEFEENDKFVLPNSDDEVGKDSGTTAIVALVRKDLVVVANAGDSRAVVSRSGTALELSEDHKPEDALEKERIEAAGGKISADGRVNGGLNLSRAIGDHSYKKNEELPSDRQIISAKPDVKELNMNNDDEFLILACDGIWNVLSSQEAVDFVKERLKAQEKEETICLSTICEEMFDKCLAEDTSGDGSGCDNMTCLIVLFHHQRKQFSLVSKRKVTANENEEEKAEPSNKKRKTEK